jgi:hypothetical protein
MAEMSSPNLYPVSSLQVVALFALDSCDFCPRSLRASLDQQSATKASGDFITESPHDSVTNATDQCERNHNT